MFTGIIESVGEVVSLINQGENLIIEIKSGIASSLKIDQSVSHNGVCLTVIKCNADSYEVCAVKQTLQITNLKYLQSGDKVNLERAMILGERLDGHFVQGHIDCMTQCIDIKDENGSSKFTFSLDQKVKRVMIEKGSVTLNGVSLTVSKLTDMEFEVVIIPYTLNNTNLSSVKAGSLLNVEFDMIGKYIQSLI